MSAPDSAFHLSMLLGPMGGILALAYAAGAASGWGFCTFTILRITNRQVDQLRQALDQEKADCAREMAALNARVQQVEDRYTTGLERRLDQGGAASTAGPRRRR